LFCFGGGGGGGGVGFHCGIERGYSSLTCAYIMCN